MTPFYTRTPLTDLEPKPSGIELKLAAGFVHFGCEAAWPMRGFGRKPVSEYGTRTVSQNHLRELKAWQVGWAARWPAACRCPNVGLGPYRKMIFVN